MRQESINLHWEHAGKMPPSIAHAHILCVPFQLSGPWMLRLSLCMLSLSPWHQVCPDHTWPWLPACTLILKCLQS